MGFSPLLAVCLVLIVGAIFVRALRRVISVLLRLAFFAIAVSAAAGGIVMVMNNETIFEEPGPQQRLVRFLTMNSAAASRSGSGSVGCDMAETTAADQSAAEAAAAQTRTRHHRGPAAEAQGAAPPAAPPAADAYPELVRRGYPGLSRSKLFGLARETVQSLGGWKIVTANPAAYRLDCVYTSRILNLDDDVRIAVRPGGEIDVCSRSATARPDSPSILRLFPGDFGASIGHIKQFYEALDPRADAAYKEAQERENANQPR